MKRLIPIILLLSSCSKNLQQPPLSVRNLFTATVTLSPSANTIAYDFFVSNTHVFAQLVTTIQPTGSHVYSFQFSVPRMEWCKDSVVWQNKMYGNMQEKLKDGTLVPHWDIVNITQN